MVIYQMLRRTPYGPLSKEHGILKLLKEKTFLSVYPLHDPTYEWSHEGFLSDRQILSAYWANFKCCLKHQPINLIKKYFGTEVAFYFAFLEDYVNRMWYGALIGLMCFLYGVFTVGSKENVRSFQICKSNLTLCPSCPVFDLCRYKKLSRSCINAHITYIFDNQAIVCYGILISLWTTVSMELWKRKRASLAYKWNVYSTHVDVSVRPEYEIKVQTQRISPITGELEPYEDERKKFLHMCISYSIIMLLAIIALMVVIAVRFYTIVVRAMLGVSQNLVVRRYSALVSSATGSIISVIVMVLFEKLYIHLSKILTNLENPRTEVQYDNSYIYKRFILTFINGYAITFYIAFFQGRFYTYPGIEHDLESHIQFDICDPTGCTIGLAIHLAAVLSIKSFLMNIIQAVKPTVCVWMQKIRRSKKLKEKIDLPNWEKQYNLPPLNRFFLVNEYQEIALQYGFVVFFSSTFSLAPIFALLHGIISIRVDGQKFIEDYKRPIPSRVSGICAWEGIFKSLARVGVVVNALVMGFTLNFIPRQIYKYGKNKTIPFYENTLSIFDTNDYLNKQNVTHPSICYYQGKRFPPDHPKKYHLTSEHWYDVTCRIIYVLIYEQMVFIITAVVSYVIADVPQNIKEKMEYEKTTLMKKYFAE